MLQPRLRPSIAGLALALLLSSPARAACRVEVGDGHSALATLIRHALHLDVQDRVVSHSISVSTREATLELELGSGTIRTLSLRGGHVFVDGRLVGDYAPGGSLDRAWRRLLADGAQLDTRALLAALGSWRAPTLAGAERASKAQLDVALRGFTASAPVVANQARRRQGAPTGVPETVLVVAPAPLTGSSGVRLGDIAALDTLARQLAAIDESDVAEALRSDYVRLGAVTVRAGQRIDGNLVVFRGDADVWGSVTGSVIAVFGNVTHHHGASIGKDAVSVGGEVLDKGGTVDGDARIISREDLAAADLEDVESPAAIAARPGRPMSAVDAVFTDVRNVVAVFVACAMLGFGIVFFGRRHLEVVADTTTHSFGRSLTVGLLGQLLLLPTFAMLIVGLALTLVGILLIPFAMVAFMAAVTVALVGGYLAVAHAVGETFTRRRMAHGAFVRAPNAYGYLFTGLVGLLGLWAAAALTGWMGPVVLVFRIAAIIVTWLAATTGFGAVLLSRGGLRETFAGRHAGELSDEYLWATPPATPTAARMKSDPK
jgi:hypothetical protein